jgi:hypothetical protein
MHRPACQAPAADIITAATGRPGLATRHQPPAAMLAPQSPAGPAVQACGKEAVP